jgi:uncharacterized membrane protein HdeD (DUF308 family)
MVLKKDSKSITELGMVEKRYKCISFGMIIIGVLILANVYWYLISWPVFIGWVFILTGILKLLMHNANLM